MSIEDREFPAASFRPFLEGKTILSVLDAGNADEGLFITFTDGSFLVFRFSGCEGDIKYVPSQD